MSPSETSSRTSPPSPAPSGSASTERTLLRHASWSVLAGVAPPLAGLVIVPLCLARLGAATYGVWVSLLALSALLASPMFGVGRTVCWLSATGCGGEDSDCRRAVAAGRLQLAYGLFIALGLVLGAVPLARALHAGLAPQPARALALFVGAAFAADQLFSYSVEALTGLRRFALLCWMSFALAVTRVAAVAAALLNGGGLLALAAAYMAVAMVGALVIQVALSRSSPQLALTASAVPWPQVRSTVGFMTGSQIAGLLSTAFWTGTPLLLTVLCGPAQAAIFAVGQKLPAMLQTLSWRAAEVLFPRLRAASRTDPGEVRRIMGQGARIMLLVSLPALPVVLLFAPQLVALWLRQQIPQVATALRILCAAAVLDAVAAPAVQTLWVRSRFLRLHAIIASQLLCAGLVIWLARGFGAIAAAWGILIAVIAGCALFWWAAWDPEPAQPLQSVGTGVLWTDGPPES